MHTINRSCFIGLVCAATALAVAARPNIVLIIADDAGYADFGFMNELTGRVTDVPTPRLDALRAAGTLFSSAYTGSVCSPSRAAITTGFYQNRLGYEYNINNLTSAKARDGHFPETVTIFEWMKHFGYTTGAFGKWHIGAMADDGDKPGNRPERQGVDTFVGLWGGSRNYSVGAVTAADQLLRRTEVAADGTVTEAVLENQAPWQGLNLTVAIGQAAEAFISDHYADRDGQENPKPFFLYTAFTCPHSPLHPSPDYDDPRISGISNPDHREYASMMLTMDKAIGGILDRLDDPNNDGDQSDSVTDDTCFIFINDNGGPGDNTSSNFPLRGHKGNAEEGGIRVPMFMVGAGIPAGTVYAQPVHSVDFLPTIAHLVGGSADSVVDGVTIGSMDGVDLRPYLAGSNPTPPHELIVVRKEDRVGLRKGDWKLTADSGVYKLFNLANDLGETQNLALAEPAIFADLMHELNLFDAGSDKPRHAALDAPPTSINQNDGFIAAPPAPGGSTFVPDLVIIGGSILNGDFNASGATGTETFAQTEAWQNIGTGGQSQTATNSNLDLDGTRNAILAKTDIRTFGLDTGYTVVGGELLHTSYQWRDALDWTDASDRVAVTLFTTDNDDISGTRTVIEVALSNLSQADNAYQAEDHVFEPVPAGFAGKRLFIQLNPEQTGTGFARLDNFVLERGTTAAATDSRFAWGDIDRWKDADTGLSDTLLSTDAFPGAVLAFPSRTYSYTATNDLTRMTGPAFMLNRLEFSGADAATITLAGKGLVFTASLDGTGPRVNMDVDNGTVTLNLGLLLMDDLLISGSGTGILRIGGLIEDEWAPNRLIKQGPFTLRFTAPLMHAGHLQVDDGTLSIGDSIGTLAVNDLSLAGVLEIDLAADASDQLVVDGTLALAGASLRIVDAGGAFPAQARSIVSYTALTGEFSTISGLPAGYHVDYAYNDGGHGRHIAIVPNAPFDDWAFGTSGLSGSAAAFWADPNGDGVPNGLAYFLGMADAHQPAAAALPLTGLRDALVRLSFARLKDASGVGVRLLDSADLSNWSILQDGLDGVSISVSTHPRDPRLEAVEVSAPAGNAARFIRLEVFPQ